MDEEVKDESLHQETLLSNNKIQEEDRDIHDWFRFVLSYPPHLVKHYLDEFGAEPGMTLLDPFCGTGTTLVEGKKQGLNVLGLEANDYCQFASKTKLEWNIDTNSVQLAANEILENAILVLSEIGIKAPSKGDWDEKTPAGLLEFNEGEKKLTIKNGISPFPLHKILILRNLINKSDFAHSIKNILLLGLSTTALKSSNIRFGPEVGVSKKRKLDAPVFNIWIEKILQMSNDVENVENNPNLKSRILSGDCREIGNLLKGEEVDFVITSPPYPNEKDYTRTVRLESVLLGFITSREDLRRIKTGLLCSNTRAVYKVDNDDEWIKDHEEINRIADEIEARRIELGKTSGFEKLYARVTRLYFGGMKRHLSSLKSILKPGAKLAYVVGDQQSYFRIMIRTGELLGDIAEELGYTVHRIDLFRSRWSTVTREWLREEVLVMEYNPN